MPIHRSFTGRVSLLYSNSRPNPFLEPPFVGTNEPQLQTHAQLPQFHPRTNWPSTPLTGLGKHTERLRTDALDPASLQVLHSNVEAAYPNLTPMPAFHDVDDDYNGAAWKTHVAAMHNVLFRTLCRGGVLEDIGMSALLRTISYGMFESTAFLDPWHVEGRVGTSTRRKVGAYPEIEAAEFNMMMKDGTFRRSGNNKTWHRDHMMGRRYIVVPVRYGDYEWGMTIFDRRMKQLYIFEAGAEDERRSRLEACTHLWARFWNWLGMPFSFTYFMPAVSALPRDADPGDSGFAAVMWLVMCLRNQVGEIMAYDDPSHVNIDIIILPQFDAIPLTNSSLRLSDWLPDGCRTIRQGIDGMHLMFHVLLANELGIQNKPELKTPFGTANNTTTPEALLQKAKTYVDTDVMFPRDEYWTGQGGPQFTLPARSSIKPYDAGASRAFKRRDGASANSRFRIKKHYRDFTYRNRPAPDRQVTWNDNYSFTPNHPFPRGRTNTRLHVMSLNEYDDAATESDRFLKISVQDSLAPLGRQVIEKPVRVGINVQWIPNQNGNRVMRLNVDAGVDGDTAKTIPVDFIVPLGF